MLNNFENANIADSGTAANLQFSRWHDYVNLHAALDAASAAGFMTDLAARADFQTQAKNFLQPLQFGTRTLLAFFKFFPDIS